ncbi:glycosyltransferase family 9 protein [Deferribacter thermophilus]|uniref:glycosyltransferase family 9 protein n=1 Tax=Deferribacter thermophilus TaxID=53573 RepID=UPI003C2211D0
MNILVFNPSFIGDSILTTPLCKALKKLYPDSRIFFCVRPESTQLFDNLKFIDKVISFDKRGEEKGLKGVKSFVKKINSETKIDLLISAHKSLRSTLTCYLIKAKKSVGFKEAALSFLYNLTVNRDMSLHEVERNLMLLQPVVNNFSLKEIKTIAGKPEISYSLQMFNNIKNFLEITFPNKKYIGIAPGSVWPTKMWPAEYYAKLIDLLPDNCIPIVFGAKSEVAVVEEIKKSVKKHFIDLSGKTNLLELSTWIRALDLLVSNDSAPLHMAVSHNVPVVAIFGPTVKSLGFYPYDEKSIVVEVENLYCRPCGLHGGKKCPEKHFRCMRDIKPQTVLESILRFI